MNAAFNTVITASQAERRDLFLAAAARLGTAVQNVEKDFWVCWTLDALFNGLPAGGPRLMFKGGTSLSKAFGLISRFSEDIDITVFREDLGQGAHAADLEALSGKKRRARLDAIRAACQTYITGTMIGQLAEIAAVVIPDAAFKLEADPDDKDGQTLLFWYPAVTAASGDYIRAAVKIEAGAKSAIDPHVAATVAPYVAQDFVGADLTVANITTVKPERTFWDKVMILHGLRQWHDRRKELRHEGQRVSRHYYDIHRLLQQEAASDWRADEALAMDCARHARLFFGSADLGLEIAKPGTYTLVPEGAMRDALAKDYVAMSGMIFGTVPSLDEVLVGVEQLQQSINGAVRGGGYMSDYFSDRENGPRARTEHVITPTVWAAIAATVQGLMNSGALAQRFPERCPDGQAICGCDEGALAASVMAEMPGLVWPLQITVEVVEGFMSERAPFAPSTLLVLDFIEFVHRAVAKPVSGKYHEYFSHHHLTFDQEAGQEDFRATINRLFSRNGLAFEMLTSGRIVRVLPPVLGDELRRTTFNSGDRTLDVLLEECRVKFSDRNPLARREALERLWDAWERLKSLADPDKKTSVQKILDAVTSEPTLRARLEAEAKELTDIGNSHLIRHYEVKQVPVIDVDHVDYLFHRLFAMIQLLLRKKGP